MHLGGRSLHLTAHSKGSCGQPETTIRSRRFYGITLGLDGVEFGAEKLTLGIVRNIDASIGAFPTNDQSPFPLPEGCVRCFGET